MNLRSLLRLAGALLAVISLTLTGCGSGKTKMDTAELESAFSGADAELKSLVTEATKALHAGKLFEGATALANLAKSPDKLNDAQKNAMINVGATIQLQMSEDEAKSDLKVYQAVENMMAALEGQEAPTVGINPDQMRPVQTPPQ